MPELDILSRDRLDILSRDRDILKCAAPVDLAAADSWWILAKERTGAAEGCWAVPFWYDFPKGPALLLAALVAADVVVARGPAGAVSSSMSRLL